MVDPRLHLLHLPGACSLVRGAMGVFLCKIAHLRPSPARHSRLRLARRVFPPKKNPASEATRSGVEPRNARPCTHTHRARSELGEWGRPISVSVILTSSWRQQVAMLVNVDLCTSTPTHTVAIALSSPGAPLTMRNWDGVDHAGSLGR